jgi:hypothetical protein
MVCGYVSRDMPADGRANLSQRRSFWSLLNEERTSEWCAAMSATLTEVDIGTNTEHMWRSRRHRENGYALFIWLLDFVFFVQYSNVNPARCCFRG